MRHLFVYTLFLALTINMASCQTIGGNKAVQTVAVTDFQKKLTEASVQLIDVRSPEEYAEGHLANAQNMDVNSDGFEANAGKLDKTKPVMVYCHSGKRSMKAAHKLAELGFSNIINLDGGISAWQETGLPVVK